MNKELEEALKTLEVLDKIISPLLEPVLAEYEDDLSDIITANYFALKQALLKQQEPKHYLKWEALEFEHKPLFTKVKMGETIYNLVIGFDCTGKETTFLRTDNQQIVFHEKDKQFFNDLHLEVVEE